MPRRVNKSAWPSLISDFSCLFSMVYSHTLIYTHNMGYLWAAKMFLINYRFLVTVSQHVAGKITGFIAL